MSAKSQGLETNFDGLEPIRCPYCNKMSYPTRPQPRVRCAWCGRGFNVQLTGEDPWYEQALKDLNRALAIKTDLFLAYHNLGLAYSEIGQYEQAIAVFEKELKLSPGDADTYYLLGMSYAAATTNYRRAIECLERYLELRPDAVEQGAVRDLVDRLARLERDNGGN
ncbi:MAG: tetratricopeptide repeat protein [Candidatus Coatesbacteria bacterium]|nr:tetratricopeptide repeat protein [Candidatus Coatesbacteria bacterium]